MKYWIMKHSINTFKIIKETLYLYPNTQEEDNCGNLISLRAVEKS